MYTSKEQLAKKTGKKAVGRYDFLQQILREFKATQSNEVKEQVLANLANFAYDPINYEFIRQLKVIDLFLDSLAEDNLTLVRFAIGGLCNLSLDIENKEYLLNCGAVRVISQCLASADEETVLSAITTLMFLVTPESKAEITSPEIVEVITQFSTSPNARLKNLATIFLEDYCGSLTKPTGTGSNALPSTSSTI